MSNYKKQYVIKIRMAILVQNVTIFECDKNCYIRVRGHQEHDGELSFLITLTLNTVSL